MPILWRYPTGLVEVGIAPLFALLMPELVIDREDTRGGADASEASDA
nr:hypothetical protein GCM10017611_66400 [Rhodococcus wratislaviensis]